MFSLILHVIFDKNILILPQENRHEVKPYLGKIDIKIIHSLEGEIHETVYDFCLLHALFVINQLSTN